MQLIAKFLTGKHITLNVDSSDTIEDLKVKIYDNEGLPVSEQRIVYLGRLTEDGRTLADYDITDEKTVYVIQRLRS